MSVGGNRLLFSGCVVGDPALDSTALGIAVFSSASNKEVIVSDSRIHLTVPSGSVGIQASIVENCHIVGHSSGSTLSYDAVSVIVSASGNTIEGSFINGIRAAQDSKVIGNTISLTPPAVTGSCVVVSSGSALSDNTLSMQGTYAGKCISSTSPVDSVIIQSNVLRFTAANTAINLPYPSNSVLKGNSILNPSADGSIAISLSNPSNTVLANNIVNLYKSADHGNEYAGTAFLVTGSGNISINGNVVYSYTPLDIPNTITSLIESNQFNSLGSTVVGGTFTSNKCSGAWVFKDNTIAVGNTFTSADETDDYGAEAGVILQPSAANCRLSFCDNYIDGASISTGYSLDCASVSSTSSMDVSNNSLSASANIQAAKALIFNSNIVPTTAAVTSVAGGSVEVVGNTVGSVLTVSPVNSTNLVIGQNAVGGFSMGMSITGLRGEFTGNRIGGSGIALTAPASCDTKITFSGNTGGAVSLVSDPSSVARLEFSSNRFLATSIDAASGNIVFSSNTVEGNTVLVGAEVTNNHFTQVTVSATNCPVFSNNIVLGLTVVSASTSSLCSFSGNSITALFGSVYLSSCRGSGNDIQSVGITLDSCSISDSYLYSLTGGISCTGDSVKVSGCKTAVSLVSSCPSVSLSECSFSSVGISFGASVSLKGVASTAGPVSVSSNYVAMEDVTSYSYLSVTLPLSGTAKANHIAGASCTYATITGDSGQEIHLSNVRSSSYVSISGVSQIDVGSSNIGGDLKVEAANHSDVILITATRVGGDIKGVSSVNVVGAIVVDGGSFGDMETATGYSTKLDGCLFKSFNAHGAGSPSNSVFDIIGCTIVGGYDGTGQVYANSTTITANIKDCSLDSILLDGRVHDVTISNNQINGSRASGCPAIQMIDGDENSRVSINGNTILTSGVDGYGAIHMGVKDLSTWPSPSGVVIPNVSIDSNIIRNVAAVSGLDIIKFTARVVGGTISNNKIFAYVSTSGTYIKLETGNENTRPIQCNNIVLSGNVLLRFTGHDVLDGNRTKLLMDLGGSDVVHRVPGRGDSVMVGVDETTAESGGALQYKFYLYI